MSHTTGTISCISGYRNIYSPLDSQCKDSQGESVLWDGAATVRKQVNFSQLAAIVNLC